MLINEIDFVLKKFKNKKTENENKSEITHNESEQKNNTDYDSMIRVNSLRASMPINSVRRRSKNYDKKTVIFSQNLDVYKSPSPIKKMSGDSEAEENEAAEKNKKKIPFLKNLNSSKLVFTDNFNKNNDDEENKNESTNFLRFCHKKSCTIGANTNNLEIKLFNYQEELKDNNYITKMKKSKTFLNFIDIDLFLQYIAIGKNFYEYDEENVNLIEGFCMQYYTFIFPETLINKVISCFDYFYNLYLGKDNKIIEEKNEDEEESNSSIITDEDEEEDENNNGKNKSEHKKRAFKIRKRINSFNIENSSKKIPFALIDFLYTFINFHNTYFHYDLSHDLIMKISNFLKRLIEIKEIKEKYEQKIDLSQIELKEYEASIKKFEPLKQNYTEKENKEDLSSSDDFSAEDENNKKKEKIPENKDNDDKKPINDNNINIDTKADNSNAKKINIIGKKKSNIDKKNEMFSHNQTFKLSNYSTFNEKQFVNIYKDYQINDNINVEENKKTPKNKKNTKDKKDKEKEKPFEFDILKYTTLDIASELARVNYSLFSKIKVKEFLKGAFNGKEKYKLSPHICQIIKRFNTISTWVTEEILAYDHAEKRSRILLKFLHLCTSLKKIGDFDDCLSVLTGITNYNISKLHKTWGHIPSDEMANFRQLQKLLSFEGNWKNLRKEVDQKIEEKSFFIPYLGYYTKRMMYLEEMGPYIKKNTSLINIEKIVEVYKSLKSFYQIKNVKKCKYICTDENVKKELVILQCLEPSNEDFLVQTSNLLEPKFILSSKKLNIKRRTKTDINFLNNLNKINII